VIDTNLRTLSDEQKNELKLLDLRKEKCPCKYPEFERCIEI
jgi:hypothetical protein